MQVTLNQAPVEGTARAPLSAWYALAVLVFTTVFAFVDRQILNLVMPSLQTSLGLSDLQLGALQGLGLAIFASVASYPMGWLADRYGRRLLLVIGIVIWSLSTAACAFQTTFAGLFGASIGIAVGEAGLMPIIFALIPDLFRQGQRNAANFLYFASTILGGAIGVALGGAALGWLASHSNALPAVFAGRETWRAAILLVALPAPLFILLVALLPIRGSGTDATVATIDAGNRAQFLPFVSQHRATFGYLFGGVFGYCLPLSAAYGWLPVATFRAFGLSPAQAGIRMGSAMGIASVVGVALPSIGLRLWPRGGSLKSISIARLLVVLAVIPTILLPAAGSATFVFAAAAVQLSLCIAVAALMPGVLQDLSPDALRSRLLSLVGIVLALGHAVSPLAVGALSGWIGNPRSVLLALTTVGVVGFGLALVCFSLLRTPMTKTLKQLDGKRDAVPAAEEHSLVGAA